MSKSDDPINDRVASLLPRAWQQLQQAVEALASAREAEDFQAIGVRLRECLVSYAGEVASEDLVADGAEAPQGANVVGWTELLADRLAAGSSAERLRSYLKKVAKETWAYVQWLTHAKDAHMYDAEIGIAAVSHVLATVAAARLRWEQGGQRPLRKVRLLLSLWRHMPTLRLERLLHHGRFDWALEPTRHRPSDRPPTRPAAPRPGPLQPRAL